VKDGVLCMSVSCFDGKGTLYEAYARKKKGFRRGRVRDIFCVRLSGVGWRKVCLLCNGGSRRLMVSFGLVW